MDEKKQLGAKHIILVAMIAFSLIVVISGHSLKYMDVILNKISYEIDSMFRQKVDNENMYLTDESDDDDVKKMSEEIVTDYPYKNQLLNINGSFARGTGLQDYYSDSNIYALKNNYLVGVYSKVNLEYEYNELLDFYNFLTENGINLVYVAKPTKYFDDSVICDEFGINSYINENSETFLQMLDDSGICTIDMRDKFNERGLDSFSLYYRTDHHWKVPAGKITSEEIASVLNENFGYSIDLLIYDDSKYNISEYKNCWLGEQGRKVGMTYVGLDDYTLVEPAFSTNFTTYVNGEVNTGAFSDVCIDYSRFEPENNEDLYEALGWHYAYMPNGIGTIVNNNVSNGNILILGDSFDHITVPFLALSVQCVTEWEPRYMNGNLREQILANNFDTVIVCYTDFMLGAHEDPSSANYRQFTFE